jgi:glycosyltransferase involved in cell wall biosynthesis
MKVAIVAPLVSAIREPQRGGSQAFLSDLARGLAARGHAVDLYGASGSEVPGVRVVDTGVDPEMLAASLYRASGPAAGGHEAAQAAFAGVYAAVREARYDVVHNHAFDPPAIALAGGLRAPVVHTLHLPPDAAVADAVRAAARSEETPTVAVVSAAQARAWGGVVGVDAILPPLVPTRAIRFSPSPGDGAVFAGRLSPEKGALEAIEIARVAELPIQVFGDAYDADYARRRIEPRRADPGVVLHDSVPRAAIWDTLAGAVVVLCPALWDEPFGMVAAEAQACGTPVVAFRSGALDEVIVDGVTGFLVAPGDVGAAAYAVRKAANLSRASCRKHAETRLDLELSLDTHERLYERVARGRVEVGAGG